MTSSTQMCHCDSGLDLGECCGPLLQKKATAKSPEALMRSRYSAFVLQDFDYLLRTHDPETVSEFDVEANKDWAKSVQFTKLEIINSSEKNEKGQVKFNAYFMILSSQEPKVHHEKSIFRKIKGQWYFRSGSS